MLQSGDRVERGSTLRADVCIIGAGAAGISIAQALIGSPARVLLLESGGLEPDSGTQRLAEGTVRGNGQQPPLHTSRLRYFGGTTNHWVGWCAPLDEIDFAQRSWVPDSGWPISRAALTPYYRRAHEVCDLGPFDYETPRWGPGYPLPGFIATGGFGEVSAHPCPRPGMSHPTPEESCELFRLHGAPSTNLTRRRPCLVG